MPSAAEDAQASSARRIVRPAFTPEADALRRSIYIFQRRAQYVPYLETFDAPVFNSSCERRRPPVTSLQALSMYDSEFVNEESRWLAKRIRDEAGADPNEQIVRAFQIAFSRPPSPQERKSARGLMDASKADALTALCRVLLNTNEFVTVD